MSELNRHWTAGRMRKHLCIRWWGSWWSLRAMPRNMLLWLRGGYAKRFSVSPIRFELFHRVESQDECWCSEGSQTQFRVEFFGFGSWGWLSRSWTLRPCPCDLGIWAVFPDQHQDDIEEYGRDRFEEYLSAGKAGAK